MSELPDWDDIGEIDAYLSKLSKNVSKSTSSSTISANLKQESTLNFSSKFPLKNVDPSRIKEYSRDSSNSQTTSQIENILNNSDQSSPSSSALKFDPSSTESFAYREHLLNISESCRLFTEYINRIDDHISSNGDVDEKIVESLYSFIFDNNSTSKTITREKLLQRLPREATMLYENERLLERNVGKMLKTFIRCLQTRKDLYSSQIKKTRDHCNMVVRQAVQAEKAESGTAFNALKEKYEIDFIKQSADLRKNLDIALEAKKKLEKELKDSKESHEEFALLRDDLVGERDRHVKEALRDQYEEFEIDKSRMIDHHLAEVQRVKDETNKHIEYVNKQHEVQLQTQGRYLDEMKSMLTAERARIEGESLKLREQILDLQNQLTLEKERTTLRHKDDTKKHEREIQQLHNTNLQEQAKLKADLQAIVQKMKNEELKRHSDVDVVIAREKEVMETAFNLKLERVEHQYRGEVKRIQAQCEVKKDEELSRLKHIHEQEIRRLLRDNDRLNKVVSRSANTSDLKQMKSYHSNNDNHHNIHVHTDVDHDINNIRKSYDHKPSESVHASHDRTSQSNVHHDFSISSKDHNISTARQSSSNLDPKPNTRWSKLRESIEQQESYLNQSFERKAPSLSLSSTTSSRRDDLPNSFMLDDAYETAKLDDQHHMQHNVSQSAKKVGNYMNQLQAYLERESPLSGHPKHNKLFNDDDGNVDENKRAYDSDSSKSTEYKHDISSYSSSLFGDSVINMMNNP